MTFWLTFQSGPAAPAGLKRVPPRRGGSPSDTRSCVSLLANATLPRRSGTLLSPAREDGEEGRIPIGILPSSPLRPSASGTVGSLAPQGGGRAPASALGAAAISAAACLGSSRAGLPGLPRNRSRSLRPSRALRAPKVLGPSLLACARLPGLPARSGVPYGHGRVAMRSAHAPLPGLRPGAAWGALAAQCMAERYQLCGHRMRHVPPTP